MPYSEGFKPPGLDELWVDVVGGVVCGNQELGNIRHDVLGKRFKGQEGVNQLGVVDSICEKVDVVL